LGERLLAIWNDADIDNLVNNGSVSKQIPQTVVTAQAVVNPTQKQADEKLARQRKIWKAKWDAEQKAKHNTKNIKMLR